MVHNAIKKAIVTLIVVSVLLNGLVWFSISRRYPKSGRDEISDRNFDMEYQYSHDIGELSTNDSYLNFSSLDWNSSSLQFHMSPMNISQIIIAKDIPELKKQYTWPVFQMESNAAIRKFYWTSDISNDKAIPCGPRRSGGPILVPLTTEDLQDLNTASSFFQPQSGGVWSPDGCRPLDRVAILVPYRNREENLKIFIHHMHAFMQRQGIDYGIYIIEQIDTRRFNRAKLFNIGFLLTQLMHNYTCYILHDIDKLPENPDYLYRCSFRPLHMPNSFRKADFNATATTSFNRTTAYFSARLYEGFFGGVSSLKASHFLKINGLINSYWGWGAEDDELYSRLCIKKLKPIFSRNPAAQYVILYHKPDAVYSKRGAPNIRRVRRRMVRNGLNSVNFKLNNIIYKSLYTHIKVLL